MAERSNSDLERICAELASYQAAFDQHSIVAVTDRSGKIIRVNDLFCRISQYSRAELIGQNHRMINSGYHPRSFWAAVWRTIARGGVWQGEVCNRAKDGSLYWVNTTIVPLKDSDGNVLQYIAVRTDITDVKRSQVELTQAKEAADAANRTKSEFLANMSHEIRTPMTAILGFNELLNDLVGQGGVAPQARDYIATVRRNGEHLLAIINDILDMAKIEAGKLTVECIDTSPAAVIEEVVASMRAQAGAKGLELELVRETALPVVIHTDPTRLRQVLVNLVGNAIKFCERGKVSVRVRHNPARHGRPALEFEVIDTGIGMTGEEIGRLFQPFEQADATMTRRFGGSGLGLRISASLVQMLGGGISVTSTPGLGSTFRFHIDTGAADRAELTVRTAAPNAPQVPAPIESPSLQGLRVLFVEDGGDNQRLISQFLTEAGATVTLVDNGRHALQALQHTVDGSPVLIEPAPFDLLITDIQMPGMDGCQLLRLLRAGGSTLPAIALTAHAMSSDERKCLEAGATVYGTKPITRQRLLELCRRARPSPPQAVPTDIAGATEKIDAAQHEPVFSEITDPEMTPLISEFVDKLPQRMRTLQRLLQERRLPELTTVAQQLHSAAGAYGFRHVANAAGVLAERLHAGHGPAALELALGQLLALAQRVRHQPPPDPSLTTTVRVLRAEADDSNQRVLVIDDAPIVHELIERHLRDFSVVIEHANDAVSGLRMAVRNRPDLILLDYDMEGINGIDAIRRLKADEHLESVPVIFITGSGDAMVEVNAFRSGAVDYLRKPFQPAVLRARVRAALQTQALLGMLEREAMHDRLTGLPNRALIQGRIGDAVARCRADPSRHYAVLFLDFDRFKLLNDTLGHEAGDELLRQIAQRMRSVTRANDMVGALYAAPVTARLGGDEFVVLLEGIAQREDAVVVAQRLLTSLAEEFDIRGHRVVSTASIGIVMGDASYASATEVLRDADAAMYEAKAAGRARCVVFDAAIRARVEGRVQMERDLRSALDRDEFFLEYQPIVSLADGRLEGVEALLRWNHPQRGRIPPSQFVPLAEETGLINLIGEWSMRRACEEFAGMRAIMGERAPAAVSVNVSRYQLGTSDLPLRVQAVLESTGVEPAALHIEVTENGIMEDPEHAVRVLRALKELGVGIHVDDFGTGSSSLACLHQFPVDTLKIDRSFIMRSGSGNDIAALLLAVIQMAGTLGLRVVAEGIETTEQLRLLQSMSCPLGQGYLFGRPMPAVMLHEFQSHTPALQEARLLPAAYG